MCANETERTTSGFTTRNPQSVYAVQIHQYFQSVMWLSGFEKLIVIQAPYGHISICYTRPYAAPYSRM